MKLLRLKKTNKSGRDTRPATPIANVFSYYGNRTSSDNQTKESGLSDGRYSRWSWRTFPTLLSVLIIFVCILYLLWVDTNPRIEIVPRSSDKTLLQSKEIYKVAGKKILDESPLNRLKITLNSDKIASRLKEQFPELTDVAVITPIAGHRLLFELQPSTPAIALSSNGSDLFVIDKRGRAVVKASEVPDILRLKLPVVRDESGLELKVGKFTLTSDNVKFINRVVEQLRLKNINIDTINLTAIPNELHIRPSGHKYYIKFNMAADARLQAGTYLASKAFMDREAITPTAYIDVRVEERAYYR